MRHLKATRARRLKERTCDRQNAVLGEGIIPGIASLHIQRHVVVARGDQRVVGRLLQTEHGIEIARHGDPFVGTVQRRGLVIHKCQLERHLRRYRQMQIRMRRAVVGDRGIRIQRQCLAVLNHDGFAAVGQLCEEINVLLKGRRRGGDQLHRYQRGDQQHHRQYYT